MLSTLSLIAITHHPITSEVIILLPHLLIAYLYVFMFQ